MCKDLKKRVVSIFMAILLVVGTVLPVAAKTDKDFPDMPTDWSAKVVKEAIERGVIKGDQNGYINPKANATRAEYGAMVTRLVDLEDKADDEALSKFLDVKKSDWFFDVLSMMVGADLMRGLSSTRLEPNTAITREQAFTIVAREMNLTSKVDHLADFTDGKEASEWSKDHINGLIEKGIVEGHANSKLELKKNISRAEVAALLVRAYPLDPVDTYTFVEELEMEAQTEEGRAELVFSEDMDKAVMVEIYEDGELVGKGGMTEAPNFGTALVNLTKAGEYELVVKDGEEELARIPLTVTERDLTLVVEEVIVINATGVDVAFEEKAEEDIDDVTVEVKDNKGNIVEVKAITVAKDDKEASFSFVKAVEGKLEGVWTVDGLEYDFDLIAKLEAFTNATNQIDLKKALDSLEIENVKLDNMPEYMKTRDEFLDKLREEKKDLTVEAIQEFIDQVNRDSIDAVEEAAIVKAVNDAKEAGNQIALLNALKNEAFVRVNDSWILGYEEKITKKEESIKGIQEKINGVNDSKVKKEADIKDKEVDRKELISIKSILETYATPDEKGEQKPDTKKALEAVELQLAIVDVREATTATRLKNAIVKLNGLVEKTEQIDMEAYVDGNGKAYIEAIKEKDVKKIEDIKEAIEETNKNVEKGLIAAVKEAEDADALMKALKDLGIKQIGEINKDAYFAKKDDDLEDKDKIQEKVDEVNIAEIKEADKDTMLEKLKLIELKNIVEANIEAYVASANDEGTEGSMGKAGDAEAMQVALDAVNKKVTVDAQVKVINEAKTVAEVKEALDALANVDEVKDYLKVKEEDRDFVAAHVLEERPEEEGQYEGLGAVTTVVTAAKTAHGAALKGINELELTTTPDEVVKALEAIHDEDFDKLSNTEKSKKAQEFQAKLIFNDEGGLKTPFTALADVKALLK